MLVRFTGEVNILANGKSWNLQWQHGLPGNFSYLLVLVDSLVMFLLLRSFKKDMENDKSECNQSCCVLLSVNKA